jgi:Dyp-type peroxidase family
MAFAILRACRWAESRFYAPPPELALELAQIQGLIVDGFDALPHASYVLVDFVQCAALAAFLREHRVTDARAAPSHEALNIAFTTRGIARLELPEHTLASFNTAFREGVADPVRSARLGDSGPSAPAGWRWGGPDTAAFDAVLLLFARTSAELSAYVGRMLGALSRCGARAVHRIDAELLPDKREHFGFRGGIAQPGVRSQLPASERRGVLLESHEQNTVAPGEFFLGYRNEFGELPQSPLVAATLDSDAALPATPHAGGLRDLGRNGSYLVVRQLAQDVHGFWRALSAATSGAAERDRLAAKLVGRWPSGAPLVRSPDRDRPELADSDDFGYAVEDPNGSCCPFGAHIRRANPRDWRLAADVERAQTMSRQHRIVRRSRPYGPPLCASFDPDAILATPDDGVERGLMFLCFNVDIARQFEVIQESWMFNPSFAKLRGEVDPLLGRIDHAEADASKCFSVQQSPFARRFFGMPSAVSVRGAAYLFSPSLAALSFIEARARSLAQRAEAAP